MGKFFHRREPAAIDNQTVIRLNRDTLYSSGGVRFRRRAGDDHAARAGTRFMSLQAIDEDHYTPGVFYGAGRHTFTRQGIGTRYLVTAIRTLVDPDDPKDLDAVHALQDAIKVEPAARPGRL